MHAVASTRPNPGPQVLRLPEKESLGVYNSTPLSHSVPSEVPAIRAVQNSQKFLGHAELSITLTYTHVLNGSGRGVRDPLAE